jgi:type I restriction enzyme M protein
VINVKLDRNASYIWSVANNVRRDIYVRGTYRDVILPFTVLRWLDAVLEEGKQAELDGLDAISEEVEA